MASPSLVRPSLLHGENGEWLDRANCAGVSPDVFFVGPGRELSEEGKQLCRSCPVALECIEHAYSARAVAGYFAGLSPGEREELTLDEAKERVRERSEVLE